MGQAASTLAHRLTGQADRSVLPATPPRLRWDAPGGALWAQGEATLGATDPQPTAEAGFERGAIALGARRELTLFPNLSWSVAPQLRLEAAGDPQGLPTGPALNGSMQQELALSLPGRTRFATSFDLRDQLAAGVLAPPAGAQGGPVLRTTASVALQGQVVGAPIGTELQVTTSRAVATTHGPDRWLSCELGLAVRWSDGPPLRIAGSCPGEPTQRLTLGISATF